MSIKTESINKIVNIDGSEVELEITREDNGATAGMPFAKWLIGAPVVTPLAAWQYKQGEIDCIIEEWNDSVLFGKDQLKKSIDAMTQLNNKLKGENAQLRKEIANLGTKGNNFV